MADFSSEEMRQLLTRLSQELSQTKGDANIVAQLRAVEKAIKTLESKEAARARMTKQERKQADQAMLKDLVDELDKSKVLKDIKDAVKDSGAGPGQGALNELVNPRNAKGFSKSLSEGILKMGKFSKDIASTAVNTVTGFANLDGSLAGLAKTAGLTGTAAFAAAQFLDENTQAYRKMVATSEGTIGSIMELRETAASASLGVQEFADAIAKGTQGTRLMGAQPWAQLFTSIKEQSKSIGYYSMDTQQLISATNEYLELQTQQGNLLGKSEQHLREGFDALIKSADETANILGRTREEQLAAIKAANADPNFQRFAKGLNLSPDAEAALQNALGSFDKFGPEMKRALQEQIQFGTLVSQESQQIAAQLPPEALKAFQDIGNNLRAGTLESKNVDDSVVGFKNAVKTMSVDQQRFLADQGALTGGIFQTLNQILISADNVKDIDPDRQLATRPAEEQDPTTVAMLSIEQTLKDASAAANMLLNKVVGPLAEQFGPQLLGMVTTAQDWIKAFSGMVSGLQGMSGALTVITGALAGGALINGVSGLVTGILAGKFVPILKGFVTAIAWPISKLTTGVASFFKFFSGGAFTKMMNTTLGSSLGFALRSVAGLVALQAVESLNPMTNEDRKSELNKWIHDTPVLNQVPVIGTVADAGDKVGSTLGQYLVQNHPEMAAWINENIFGNETDPKVVKAIRGAIDKVAEEADSATETKPTEVKPIEAVEEDMAAKAIKDLEATTATKMEAVPEALTKLEPSSDLKLVEDLTYGAANDDLIMKLLQNPLNVSLIDGEKLKQDSEEMKDNFKAFVAQQEMLAGPSETIKTPEEIMERANRMLSTVDSVQKDVSVTTLLNNILAVLKQGNEFDKENGALIREKLTGIRDTNGDLVRLQKS